MKTEPQDDAKTNGVAAVAAIRRREVSATELIGHFLTGIKHSNPEFSAVRETLEDQALKKAEELDARIEKGKPVGPLAGLPVVVKENCDTKGATCSAGLSFRREHRPKEDAGITGMLRDADAIILGVSVSDPGAFSTRTPDVVHPLDKRLTVGGSSGGSAAALLSGMCMGAIGTDTGGSIRIPSACCGTVGLKPTYGSLPVTGIFPLVPSLDHVGPMARNVIDVELMWHALRSRNLPDTRSIVRIGFDPAWLSEAEPDIQHAMYELFASIKRQGIAVREIRLPELDEIAEVHGTIFIVEALNYHVATYGRHRFEYPQIAQNWFDVAEKTTAEDYEAAVAKRAVYTARVDELLGEVDLLLGPTLLVREIDKDAMKIRIAERDLDFTMGMVRATSLFDHTGHPGLAMPLSSNCEGIPPSLQIVGRKHDETRLLKFARQIDENSILA